MVGFHSQAGWIAFITVAFLFSIATRRVSWVRKDPVGTGPAGAAFTDGHANPHTAGESPATGAFLVPILAILAASLISKAASGYFEWLYPLRFVAAAIALWFSRHELSKLNWRFDWLAPLTGAAIFLMWIVPEWWTHGHASSPIGAGLTALSQPERLLWIAFRVAAAVVTVPIAEELAFRGYMARRLMDREFDAVSFTDLTLFSMAASSLLFGILHGQHWILGTLAGLAYAAVLQRRGRFGDAVVAHATSNLLLAAWVLSRNDWTQW
jgi:CAAX prenyl protease-like protein